MSILPQFLSIPRIVICEAQLSELYNEMAYQVKDAKVAREGQGLFANSQGTLKPYLTRFYIYIRFRCNFHPI